MTTQTVSQAVARKDKADHLVNWLRAQQDEIAMAAASHIKPATVVRIANGALRKDDKLMQAAIANPLSLLHCLLDAARLGHEPGTDQYYLVPFGNEVTGIEGYKGIIERMFRAGAVSAVVAEVVRQRDIYRGQGATSPPVHEYDEFAGPDERGQLRGAYAYAVMADGACSNVIKMGRAEILQHKAVSRGSDRPDSPWQRWETAMWKKTPLRGLSAYVPTSSEWLTARAQAAATVGRPVQVTGFTPPAPAHRGNGHAVTEPVVDAEIVDETPAAEDPAPPAPAPPQDHPSRLAAQEQTGNVRPARSPAAGREPHPAPKGMLLRLDKLLGQLPLGTEEDVRALLEWQCGQPYTATRGQVQLITGFLEDHLRQADGDPAEAASEIWRQYRAIHDQDGAEATQDPPDGTDG